MIDDWGLVMDERELRERTKEFALRVMKLVDALPSRICGRAIANLLAWLSDPQQVDTLICDHIVY